jgi:hypothetical protein
MYARNQWSMARVLVGRAPTPASAT